MEVLLARENGFCFGVKKAVELTEAAAETGRTVHNLGQVVHNPKISERLGALGVKVIKDPSEAGRASSSFARTGSRPRCAQRSRRRASSASTPRARSSSA